MSAHEVSLLAPTVEGSRHRWSYGSVSFEVDAAKGARITGFSIGGENILTGPETNALNYGSTLWTSPQSQWGWPPEVEIDSDPYDVRGTGADLVFAGKPGRTLGIAARKRVVVNAETECVRVVYTLENRSGKEQRVAPWEISRVPTGGLTFFPAGDGIFPPTNLRVREAEGLIWFDYDPRTITDHQKLFA